jgi:Sec-independent protein translocase protein TatA
MSHIGRIVAGTLAKRGRRGGSSVSSLISLTVVVVVVVVVVWPSKSMEVCTSEAVGRGAQNSWRGFDEEKTEGSQTTNKKGEEKRERVTTI